MVCDSLMGLGEVVTVELTSAGTLTTLPWIDNSRTLGSSRICINGMRGEKLRVLPKEFF